MIGKYFALGKYYKLIILLFVMFFWMFLFGYQYVFFNAQGELPPEKFDKKNFYMVFGLLVLGQAVTQLLRGLIAYNFALEVSAKLNSLSKH